MKKFACVICCSAILFIGFVATMLMMVLLVKIIIWAVPILFNDHHNYIFLKEDIELHRLEHLFKTVSFNLGDSLINSAWDAYFEQFMLGPMLNQSSTGAIWRFLLVVFSSGLTVKTIEHWDYTLILSLFGSALVL